MISSSKPVRKTPNAQHLIATVPPEEILPITDDEYESSIRGIYVVGDVTGIPLVKLAAKQGSEVVRKMEQRGLFHDSSDQDDRLDLVIIGAGPAGLAAALEAEELSLKYVVLEKDRLANTIRNFPAGKMVYAEPHSMQVENPVSVESDETREEFLERVESLTKNEQLKHLEGVEVTGVERHGPNRFEVVTNKSKRFPARFVIVAIGRQGNPRTLDVPGSDRDCRITYRLHTPEDYDDDDLLVVGGGNSAIEAALMLCEHNRVTLSYRGSSFDRLKDSNRNQLAEAESNGSIRVIRNSRVKEIRDQTVLLDIDGDEEELPNKMVLAFLGTLPPIRFLRDVGIELDGLWTRKRFLWMLACLLGASWIYFGSKYFVLTPEKANGQWYVPWLAAFSDGAPRFLIDVVIGSIVPIASLLLLGLTLLNRSRVNKNEPPLIRVPGAKGLIAAGAILFACYLVLPSIFTADQALASDGPYYLPGLQWLFWIIPDYFAPAAGFYYLLYFGAIAGFGLYWAIRANNRIVWKRNLTLITTQWTLWWGIPTFLAVFLGRNPWTPFLTKTLNAWPLNMSAFQLETTRPGDPEWWQSVAILGVIWAFVLTFVVIPLVTIRWGKIYCSYICSCGALAETVGNAYRHRGPKGEWPRQLERFGFVFIPAAAIATMLSFLNRGEFFAWYNVWVGTGLAGAAAIGLYPFLGQRIWCRMWCPLAFWMNFWGRWSKFKITPEKGKCIDCNVCNQYCQMGIDIKGRALRGEPVTLDSTPCVACAECVARCPMEILHLGDVPANKLYSLDKLTKNNAEVMP